MEKIQINQNNKMPKPLTPVDSIDNLKANEIKKKKMKTLATRLKSQSLNLKKISTLVEKHF